MKQEREKHANLPRLGREYYQGLARVHWVLSVKQRKTGWLDALFHSRFRELAIHAQSRHDLIAPVYCLMPDHLHLIWMGVSRKADQAVAMEFLRKFLKPVFAPLELQRPPFDHVLRKEERRRDAFQNAVHYVLDNPVRAGLVEHRSAYPFSGALIQGYPDLNLDREDYWDLFWRIYHRLVPDEAL